jgi:hypothetical protein
MPRETQQGISGVPQVQSTRAQELTQVVARPVNTAVMPREENEFAGLVSGLAQFSPKLDNYLVQKAQAERIKEQKDVEDAKLTGETVQLQDPTNASFHPDSLPKDTPLAVAAGFEQGFRTVNAQRNLITAKEQITLRYEQEKLKPGFDVDAFLAETHRETVTGFKDPTESRIIAEGLIQQSAQLRSADQKLRIDQIRQSSMDGFNTVLNDTLNQGDPAAAAAAFREQSKEGAAARQWYSRSELAAQSLDHVVAHAWKEGKIDAFNMIDKVPDPVTGKTIYESSGPEFQQKFLRAKAELANSIKVKTEEDNVALHSQIRYAFRERVKRGDPTANEDAIFQMAGKHLPLGSIDAVMSELNFLTEERDKFAKGQHIAYMAKNGMVGMLDERDQKEFLGPAAKGFNEAFFSGMAKASSDPSMVGQPGVAKQLAAPLLKAANVYTGSRATVVDPELKSFFDGIATHHTPLSADGSAPLDMQVAAEALTTLRATPGGAVFLDKHVSGDAQTKIGTYLEAKKRGAPDKEAYATAANSITQEAKEAARKKQTPEWHKARIVEINKDVDNANFEFWRDALGLVGMSTDNPKNPEVVSRALEPAEARYMADHPYADKEQLGNFRKAYIADNFVMDTNSRNLIQVPPRQAAAAQPAISSFIKGLNEPGKTDKTLRWVGEGFYQAVRLDSNGNEIAIPPYEHLSINDIIRKHDLKVGIAAEERTMLSNLTDLVHTKKDSGQVVSQADIEPYRDVIAKLKLLKKGYMLPVEVQDKVPQGASVRERVGNFWDMQEVFGKVGAAFGNIANDMIGKSPNTSKSDQRSINAMAIAKISTRTEIGMAVGLTGLGEGLRLARYQDPAKGAGWNIGFGYNIDANKATVRDDFRAANIPSDKVDAILNGKASITEDQAQRLLQHTLEKRYIPRAQGVVEKVEPGLWGKLTPHMRTVLTDVAYQVKDFNEFAPSIKKMSEAIRTKNPELLKNVLTVMYDPNGSGKKVPVPGRNEKRWQFLAGDTLFTSMVKNS